MTHQFVSSNRVLRAASHRLRFIAGLLVLLAGCGRDSAVTSNAKQPPNLSLTITEPLDQSKPTPPSDHHYFHTEEQTHAAEWGYAEENGPSRWGDLSPAYRLAKTGRRQSPIDIPKSVPQPEPLPEIEFRYRPSPINLVYNGHTVQETEDGTSHMRFSGREWELKQFHFHSPSEHTIDGRNFEMELHLVHTSDDDHVAVIGILISEGAENEAFAELWNHFPAIKDKASRPKRNIDAGMLLPMDRAYYRYSGSFTTPPCTEDVLWMVLTTPVELSAAQIATFRKVIDGNNRPVQPLNQRELEVSVKKASES